MSFRHLNQMLWFLSQLSFTPNLPTVMLSFQLRVIRNILNLMLINLTFKLILYLQYNGDGEENKKTICYFEEFSFFSSYSFREAEVCYYFSDNLVLKDKLLSKHMLSAPK